MGAFVAGGVVVSNCAYACAYASNDFVGTSRGAIAARAEREDEDEDRDIEVSTGRGRLGYGSSVE